MIIEGYEQVRHGEIVGDPVILNDGKYHCEQCCFRNMSCENFCDCSIGMYYEPAKNEIKDVVKYDTEKILSMLMRKKPVCKYYRDDNYKKPYGVAKKKKVLQRCYTEKEAKLAFLGIIEKESLDRLKDLDSFKMENGQYYIRHRNVLIARGRNLQKVVDEGSRIIKLYYEKLMQEVV